MKLSRKTLFIIVGAVIVVELVWAGLTLTGNPLSKIKLGSATPQDNTSAESNIIIPKDIKTTISLSAPKNQIKVGEKITVSININSSKFTDGTDLILFYDPKLVTLVADKNTAAVEVGKIYEDYPLNAVDSNNGKVLFSGISTQISGIIPQGVLGTFILEGKTAGKAKIMIDFTPGSTVDSNVVETSTAQDVLVSVQNLDLEIIP